MDVEAYRLNVAITYRNIHQQRPRRLMHSCLHMPVAARYSRELLCRTERFANLTWENDSASLQRCHVSTFSLTLGTEPTRLLREHLHSILLVVVPALLIFQFQGIGKQNVIAVAAGSSKSQAGRPKRRARLHFEKQGTGTRTDSPGHEAHRRVDVGATPKSGRTRHKVRRENRIFFRIRRRSTPPASSRVCLSLTDER